MHAESVLSSSLIILAKRKIFNEISAIEVTIIRIIATYYYLFIAFKSHYLFGEGRGAHRMCFRSAFLADSPSIVVCTNSTLLYLAISFILEDSSFCFLHLNLLQTFRIYQNEKKNRERIEEEGEEMDSLYEKGVEEDEEDEQYRVRVVNNVAGMEPHEVERWRQGVRSQLLAEVMEGFRMGRYKDLELFMQFDYLFCLGDPGYSIRGVPDEELGNYVESFDWSGLYQRGDEYVAECRQQRRHVHNLKNEGGDEGGKGNGKEKAKRKGEEEYEDEKGIKDKQEQKEERHDWIAFALKEGAVDFPPTSMYEEYYDGSWGYSIKVRPLLLLRFEAFY